MTVLMIDAETYSECDLRACGAHEYARHPSTRSILWSVRSPDWGQSLVFESDSLWSVLDELKKANRVHWNSKNPITLVHWSEFDRLIVRYSDPGSDPDSDEWMDDDLEIAGITGPYNTIWCDLRAISLSYGGPGSLKYASLFWGGGAEQKSEGKGLIHRFCVPDKNGQRPHPADDPVRWEEFRAYARQDTNTMVPIYHAMLDVEGGHHLLDHWPALRVVGRMNERGVPVDVESARRALQEMGALESAIADETQLEFGFKPSQVAKLTERLGIPDAQRETLEAYVEVVQPGTPEHRLASARLATSGAARKKLVPLIHMAGTDGRVRGCFDYHGAWTRRLTSFGVQFQNMVRSPSQESFFETLLDEEQEWGSELFEATRTNVRGFVKAEEGSVLAAADYKQIELRVGAWLAGEGWLLDALRKGLDPYRRLGARLFGTTEDAITDSQRQYAKVVALGCIYGLGQHGLANQAASYGLDVSLIECAESVEIYRREHPSVVQSWEQMGNVFAELINGLPGSAVEIRLGGNGQPVRMERHPAFISLIRPSGFAQYFWKPQIEWGEWPDGGPKRELSYVRRDRSGKMARDRTYGGNLYQGLVQGVAADLMLEGMLAAERAGFPPVMSVHDEVVVEVPAVDVEGTLDRLCEVVCAPPSWAQGLPIEADGWVSKRFTK